MSAAEPITNGKLGGIVNHMSTCDNISRRNEEASSARDAANVYAGTTAGQYL